MEYVVVFVGHTRDSPLVGPGIFLTVLRITTI